MSAKINNYRESDGTCQFCGKQEELRPYGPKGEWICYDCGMKDEAATQRQFLKTLNPEGVTVLDVRKL